MYGIFTYIWLFHTWMLLDPCNPLFHNMGLDPADDPILQNTLYWALATTKNRRNVA